MESDHEATLDALAVYSENLFVTGGWTMFLISISWLAVLCLDGDQGDEQIDSEVIGSCSSCKRTQEDRRRMKRITQEALQTNPTPVEL